MSKTLDMHAYYTYARTQTTNKMLPLWFFSHSLSSFSEGLAERKWKKPLTFFGYYEINMDGFFRSISYIVYIYISCVICFVCDGWLWTKEMPKILSRKMNHQIKASFVCAFRMACLQFVFVEMLS